MFKNKETTIDSHCICFNFGRGENNVLKIEIKYLMFKFGPPPNSHTHILLFGLNPTKTKPYETGVI